jgi:hypothetical protein
MSRLAAVPALLLLMTANACQDQEPPRWHYTCGDPVCVGYTPKPGIPLCTSEAFGNRCENEGVTCDPKDDCNRLLVCTVEDAGLLACPDLP